MIGNDVVWLDDPRNKGRNTDVPLVSRILTPRERLMVQVSGDPDRMLWSLWAAKEAAFKAVSRAEPKTVFAPIRFEVNPDPSSKRATVTFGNLSVPVLWVQGKDWVHAAACDDLNAIQSTVERCAPGLDDSTAVRELAARALLKVGYAGTITGRPPVLQLAEGEIPVSLSHDGPYLAVVFVLPL